LIIGKNSIHNLTGTIKAIYKFSRNSGNDIPLSFIYEFKYDDQNRVYEKKTYFTASEKYTSIDKYHWSTINIERVEHFNGEGKLYYEYFFTYDDKKNYRKGLPVHIDDPVNWSENNITAMNWNDYLGNLDLICRPCTRAYQYNLDGFPISVKFNWGLELRLTYE